MDDIVTEKLLACLSKYVIYSSLTDFTVKLLDIPYARFTQIKAKSEDATERTLQVLLEWHHRGPRTSKDVFNLTVDGVTFGCIAFEALEAICVKAHLDQNQPDLKKTFETLKADQQKQIALSCSDEKSQSFQNITKLTRQTFKSPPFTLAVHSEWSNTPRRVKLNDIYTDLRWVHIHRKPCDVLKQDIDGYWQMLVDKELGDGPVRILVVGEAGIGKTTFTHILAIEWATRVRKELEKFDLVFTIPLRDVKPHHRVEDVIVLYHRGLKAKRVKEEEIKEVLDDEAGHRILIVMDGYDEYIPGTNTEIDEAVNKLSLWNSWIIITSRPSDDLNKIRQYVDAEARILGFTEDNVLNYASKFLQNREDAKKLVAKGKSRGMMDILTIPIMLQMVCELYVSGKDLPQTKTEIIESIFRFSFDRATRRPGVTWSDEEISDIMYKLGRLSWESLQKETQQLLLEKDTVFGLIGDSILTTGLLLTTEDYCSSGKKYLTFQHKMLQEYAAAHFLHIEYHSKRSELYSLFPTLRCIIDQSVVLQFLCGQSEVMSETVMGICCQVVAKSFAANLGEVQCFFSVDWLIDERAYLSGINQIMPAYTIMSWSDAVGIYLQTTFETIRTMHRECKQPERIKSFSGKDLWVLSPEAWSIPLDPPMDQKLVIVHSLDTNTASTYLSARSEKPQRNGCNQSIMITEPCEDYNHVVPCLTKVTTEMEDIITIFLCELVFNCATDKGLQEVQQLSRALFNRQNLRYVVLLKSTVPEIFYSEMFKSLTHNVELQKLDLYFCDIPHSAATLMSHAMANLSKLTSLKLRHCLSKLSEAEVICKQICHLVSLKHLDLSMNPELGQCASILARTFSKWKNHPLEKLWIRECHIPVDQGQVFMKSLTNLPNLRLASLPCNGFNGSLCELMSKTPPLEELYIWKTGLTTGDVFSLAAAVQSHRLPTLRRLHIERNNLTDEQIEPLLAKLNDSHSAEMLLDVSNNNLTKEFVEDWSKKVRNGLNICWYLDKKY